MDELETADADPDYVPKGVLLTRAPAGLVGELASTYDATVPWLNLRQGDVFEVVEPARGTDIPRLRYRARISSVQDVGGGRVWPASYQHAMDALGGKVTDYLAMALKPGEEAPDGANGILSRDHLSFYYEGSAQLDEVTDSIFEAIPMLATTGPKLGTGTFDMNIVHVRTGTLRRCRQQKSQDRGGSPGPLKHRVVRGPQYEVPIEDMIAVAPAWRPPVLISGIRPAATAVGLSSEGSSNPHGVPSSASGKKAG
jgi:hypothetical protein